MNGPPVSDPHVANPIDTKLRDWLDLRMEDLAVRLEAERERIEAQEQEIRRQSREILFMKKTLGLLKKEREQMRALLRSLETRLVTLQEKTNEPGTDEKN